MTEPPTNDHVRAPQRYFDRTLDALLRRRKTFDGVTAFTQPDRYFLDTEVEVGDGAPGASRR